MVKSRIIVMFVLVLAGFSVIGTAFAQPLSWQREWPNTDFSKHSVEFEEIMSGGPPKDGIPSIDTPEFKSVEHFTHSEIGNTEPVMGIVINGQARAYPIRIVTWHEIVNDTLGGVPIAVTFCPLCNSGIVFDRRIEDRVLEFGTTGKLRKSDMVMYDRQTESWWQQFLGTGIVGEMTGKSLTMLPSRMESFGNFKKRFPGGEVLVPSDPNMRRYGVNPYQSYDSASRPFLYDGELPEGINPMERVVAIGDQAWSLTLLKSQGMIKEKGLVITWQEGQNSALDTRSIREGRDVGNITVQRDGEDIVHDIVFAFVFHAFRPSGTLKF